MQYVRTPMGRAAAFSPDAKLSPKLRVLLKAVDGKTSASALVVEFPEHDTTDLLNQLEKAGLIKLRVERLSDVEPLGFVPELFDFPDAAVAEEPFFAATVAGGLEQLPAFHEAPSVQSAANVARIVGVMATFVRAHIPQQAFTVLAKLESLQTLDELKAELPAYSLLAKESGPAGIVHLAELTERLREADAA